ncbi:hypothetical protein CALCODRAFT_552634 [Calocera cornea HHB12733]|uniref:C2 domain-containing protein n=1 Tax=Calocera cornea HHB12733 TaxID=1353952 RepID=A0A165JUF3_9BASI|nr:hypothetical protein CALCODRAFT_552634 [Calocera cornea HHB12733]
MARNAERYDVQLTFHRAAHIPIGDFPALASDPFLVASLFPHSPNPPSHSHPNPSSSSSSSSPPPSLIPLQYRTPTVRRTLTPTWDAHWIVGGVPPAGVRLELEMRDEDPGDHDDLLGVTGWDFPPCNSDPSSASASEGVDADADAATKAEVGSSSGAGSRSGRLYPGLEARGVELKIFKRKGTVRSHAFTYLAAAASPNKVSRHGRVWVSLRVLGPSGDDDAAQGVGGMYTLGPHHWSEHFSPLLGHVTHTRLGTSAPSSSETRDTPDFPAYQLQLSGPLPPSLKFQYVAYRPFIGLLFSRKGWRGWALNRALRKQHDVVYGYGRRTRYGVVGLPQREGEGEGEGGKGDVPHGATSDGAKPDATEHDGPESEPNVSAPASDPAPASSPSPSPFSATSSQDLAARFLSMTSYGTGGRLFTYVLMLDGQWRFTETGPAFAVQFLSKHSMHSGVATWIAFSGEFFVRRLEGRGGASDGSDAAEGGRGAAGSAAQSEEEEDQDPAHYELVIDNDSGTYRPNKAQLPDLHAFLTSPRNLCALGKVTVMDGFDETLKGWKERQERGKEDPVKGEDARGAPAPPEHGEEPALVQRRGSSLRGRIEGKVMGKVEETAGEHEREEAAAR